MTSPVFSQSAPRAELSPAQASFVYWLNGIAPVVTNIVTPLVVFWKMGRSQKPVLVKYNQQVNEVVRQFISGTVGLLSYFGGGELTKGTLNRVFERNGRSLDEASRQVAMIVGGVAMSFIGYAFVRPYLGTELICRFLKQEKGLEQTITVEKARLLLESACSNSQSLQKGLRLLEGTLKDQAVKEAGVKSGNSVIRWLQNQVDQHLLPNGQPNLKKTALLSTAALSAYLGLLTTALWVANRALGRQPADSPKIVKQSKVATAPTGAVPRRPAAPVLNGVPLSPSLYFAQQGLSSWSPLYRPTGR